MSSEFVCHLTTLICTSKFNISSKDISNLINNFWNVFFTELESGRVSLVIIEPVAEQSQKERIHKQANKKWVFKIYIYIECIKLNKPTS